MAEANRTATGAIDRAIAAIGGINRRALAWGGILLAAVTLLSVNLIASTALRNAKFDLTEERLFTISDGTRKALRAIDEPIDVRVYFSTKLGELAPTYGKSFERVRTMLDRYRERCRGSGRAWCARARSSCRRSAPARPASWRSRRARRWARRWP